MKKKHTFLVVTTKNSPSFNLRNRIILSNPLTMVHFHQQIDSSRKRSYSSYSPLAWINISQTTYLILSLMFIMSASFVASLECFFNQGLYFKNSFTKSSESGIWFIHDSWGVWAFKTFSKYGQPSFSLKQFQYDRHPLFIMGSSCFN